MKSENDVNPLMPPNIPRKSIKKDSVDSKPPSKPPIILSKAKSVAINDVLMKHTKGNTTSLSVSITPESKDTSLDHANLNRPGGPKSKRKLPKKKKPDTILENNAIPDLKISKKKAKKQVLKKSKTKKKIEQPHFDESEVIKQGKLFLYGKLGSPKEYQIYLLEKQLLWFGKDNKQKGSIDLDNVTLIDLFYKKKYFGITLVVSGSKYAFAALSPDERDSWIYPIREKSKRLEYYVGNVLKVGSLKPWKAKTKLSKLESRNYILTNEKMYCLKKSSEPDLVTKTAASNGPDFNKTSLNNVDTVLDVIDIAFFEHDDHIELVSTDGNKFLLTENPEILKEWEDAIKRLVDGQNLDNTENDDDDKNEEVPPPFMMENVPVKKELFLDTKLPVSENISSKKNSIVSSAPSYNTGNFPSKKNSIFSVAKSSFSSATSMTTAANDECLEMDQLKHRIIELEEELELSHQVIVNLNAKIRDLTAQLNDSKNDYRNWDKNQVYEWIMSLSPRFTNIAQRFLDKGVTGKDLEAIDTTFVGEILDNEEEIQLIMEKIGNLRQNNVNVINI